LYFKLTGKVIPKVAESSAKAAIKYGPTDDISKFRGALSKAALKEFGQLEKLIKQERIERPLAGKYVLLLCTH